MKDFTDTYWICDDCADKRGWKAPDNGITVIRGKCGHCKSGHEVTLIPVRDFTHKGNRVRVWD